MDAVEKTLAVKRTANWPREWKADLIQLPPSELEVVGLLVALMDARPSGEMDSSQ